VPQSKRHPARRPQQRPAKTQHRNPQRSSQTSRPTTTSTGWRLSLEKASVRPLLVLKSMPTWLVPVLLAAVMVAGLMIPSPWAGLLLLLPAFFLLWLLVLSWPLLSTTGRLLRVLVIAVLLGATWFRVTGQF
jgi:hypothetical protein